MAKNKKNKNAGQKKVMPSTPVKKITDDVKESASNLEEKTIEKMGELGIGEPDESVELSKESAEKLEAAAKKEDVQGYLQYLRNLNLRLEAIQKQIAETKEKIDAAKQKIEEEKKKVEDDRKKYQEKLEAVNKKDQNLTEQQMALENGEYSSVVRSLLDKMKETEHSIFEDTGSRIEELKSMHSAAVSRITESQSEFEKLEDKKLELLKAERELKRSQKRLEIERKSIEEDIKEEFQLKYDSELKTIQDDLDRYKKRFENLSKEKDAISEELEKIRGAFDGAEPSTMVEKIQYYKDQVLSLTEERDQRIDPEIYEQEVTAVKKLKESVRDLQAKVSEKELAEIQELLAKDDQLSVLRMKQKFAEENAEIKEKHYLSEIASLRETIRQLQDDSTKNTAVFEYALAADKEPSLQDPSFDRKEPNDLSEFVSYIQKRMVSSTDNEGNKTSFYYDQDTIRIFLAGLNMSPLTLLWGISGTGKTSLPREFAKAMMADKKYFGVSSFRKEPNASYRICEVQSGWRDRMDLMGYYNSFEKKYNETKFFKAIYMANQPKYRNTLFFIILDEMNLSRPEHYFADFLSMLEQSEDQWYITINDKPETWTAHMDGGKLRVPENVRFIGTANHDETTLEFAPKTYDRSNVIELPRNIIKKGEGAVAYYNISYTWLKERFNQAETTFAPVYAKFKDFLDKGDLKKLLEEQNIGIGNRFEKQAEKFITVFVASGSGDYQKDLAKAADHLITSRLLRTMRDRYELNKENLQSFRLSFEVIFEDYFKQKPTRALALLDDEIKKKTN